MRHLISFTTSPGQSSAGSRPMGSSGSGATTTTGGGAALPIALPRNLWLPLRVAIAVPPVLKRTTAGLPGALTRGSVPVGRLARERSGETASLVAVAVR